MSGSIGRGFKSLRLASLGLGDDLAVAERTNDEQDSLAAEGLVADIVLVHPNDDELAEARNGLTIMMERQGLTITTSSTADGKSTLLKVTAPTARLEEEAERIGMCMLLKPAAPHGDPPHPSSDDGATAKGVLDGVQNGLTRISNGLKGLGSLLGTDEPTERGYTVYTRDRREEFETKAGLLFTALERQRLLYAILEAPIERGGAQLDLDELVSEDVLSTYLSMHDSDSDGPHDVLHKSWKRCGMMPCSKSLLGVKRRVFPDLGLCQQPLPAIRDYYGEKIAFYFAWLDNNTSLLCLLMWALIALEAIYLADGCNFLGSMTVSLETAEDDMCEGAEDHADWDDPKCTTLAAPTLLVTSVLLALWASARGEMWKRTQRLLAYQWNMLDFDSAEAPRPEFIHSYRKGTYRHDGPNPAMTKQAGFYTSGSFLSGRLFVPDSASSELYVMDAKVRSRQSYWGVPLLLLIASVTLCIMLSIWSFGMLMALAVQFQDESWNRGGSIICSILSAVWITLMNAAYSKLATFITNLENQRTQTEYENSLTLKLFLFTAVNSYGSLFYLAFLKPLSIPLFDAWGWRDPQDNAYADTCGVRGKDWWASVGCNVVQSETCRGGEYDCPEDDNFILVRTDCWGDLRMQMITLMLIKPLYELPLQILLPRLTNRLNLLRRKRSIRQSRGEGCCGGRCACNDQCCSSGCCGRGGVESADGEGANDSAVASLTSRIERQIALPAFGGTVAEYNSKVVQFGLIACFSAVFPLGTALAMVVNFIELRVDAHKLGHNTRRPRYQGARSVGSWESMMGVLAWLAVAVRETAAPLPP